MISLERATTLARLVAEQDEDPSDLFDGAERILVRRMRSFLDNVECSCGDRDEWGRCWYNLTDDERVQLMASLR